MPFRDVILQQVEKKHTEWNGQIMKMAGLDYDTYSKLAVGLLAELKGYISAMCDTVLGMYDVGRLGSAETGYLIKQILSVSHTVTDAVRLTALTCRQDSEKPAAV